MIGAKHSIRCVFEQKDCFAYEGYCDGCVALVEKPKGEKCPFYKTNTRIAEEQTHTIKRLTRYGRTDLLEQYGEIEATPIYNRRK